MRTRYALVAGLAVGLCGVSLSTLFPATASANIQARYHDPHNTVANQPADAGCKWSRIQIPTLSGLRWQAEEDCPDN
jgi:hypothetical protein